MSKYFPRLDLDHFEAAIMWELQLAGGSLVSLTRGLDALYWAGSRSSDPCAALQVTVSRLRQKLRFHRILSERNKGYRLVSNERENFNAES